MVCVNKTSHKDSGVNYDIDHNDINIGVSDKIVALNPSLQIQQPERAVMEAQRACSFSKENVSLFLFGLAIMFCMILIGLLIICI
jgi:hypothetical protein